MEEVYIIESLRSPIGKFMGGMSELSAVELGAQVVRELSSRIGKEIRIDGLISGNVLSADSNASLEAILFASETFFSVSSISALSLGLFS